MEATLTLIDAADGEEEAVTADTGADVDHVGTVGQPRGWKIGRSVPIREPSVHSPRGGQSRSAEGRVRAPSCPLFLATTRPSSNILATFWPGI